MTKNFTSRLTPSSTRSTPLRLATKWSPHARRSRRYSRTRFRSARVAQTPKHIYILLPDDIEEPDMTFIPDPTVLNCGGTDLRYELEHQSVMLLKDEVRP